MTGLEGRASRLRSLHGDGPVLVLPNAWDAASAVVIEEAGAAAIATTSAGVAWALGFPDGEQLTRDVMLGAVSRIAAAVAVPVTADVEAGYGPEPTDVAATVEATLAAGAVGINLEDSSGPAELFGRDAQSERIRAARDAATAAAVPSFVINARTDVFLREIGDAGGRLDDVLARAAAYAEAGADCLFVPGLLDLAVLESLASSAPLPVSAMARPGGPTITELAATGVRRISVGPAISEAAYGLARRAARELLEDGTYESLAGAISFPELQSLLSPGRATPGGSESFAGG
ncbi:MAG: isocitrate lyase/PEP mutase family protein [Gaiellaceae bacterium]